MRLKREKNEFWWIEYETEEVFHHYGKDERLMAYFRKQNLDYYIAGMLQGWEKKENPPLPIKIN